MRRLVFPLAGLGRWSVSAAFLVLAVGAGWGTPLPEAFVFSRGELTLADALATGGGPGDQTVAPGFAQQTKTYDGPFGGTLTASVLADGTFDRMRLSSSVAISNYRQGSIVDIYDITISNWLPVAAGARLRVNDTVTLFGPDATYDLAFTWRLDGSVSTVNSDVLDSVVSFGLSGGGRSDGFREFGLDDRTVDRTFTTVLRGMPSNTPIDYSYFFLISTWVRDCEYDLQGQYRCFTPASYSASQTLDFGSTLAMTDFSILRSTGEVAAEVRYLSASGFDFPGTAQAVPEPGTFLLSGLVLSSVVCFRLRRRRNVRARWLFRPCSRISQLYRQTSDSSNGNAR